MKNLTVDEAASFLSDLAGRSFLGNSAGSYAACLAVWAGGAAVLWALKRFGLPRLRARAGRTAGALDDFLAAALGSEGAPLAAFGVFWLGLQGLSLSGAADRVLSVAGAAFLTFAGVRFLAHAVRFAVFGVWLPRRKDEALERRMRALTPVIATALWGAGAVFLLDNLGFKVSAVVAGLGIGGVAVALASQAVLGDLFSYFSILFDRPFEHGDFIVVGDLMGTVENVGVKTTRIRSLSGEELIFSNADLTGSRVRNFKRMRRRRVVFTLGLTYDTPPENLELVPALIKAVIRRLPGTEFERAHFSGFGESALTVEAVYHVLSGDYNTYMDLQQEINLAVLREFREHEIEFAFPTRTLHVRSSDSKGPVASGVQ